MEQESAALALGIAGQAAREGSRTEAAGSGLLFTRGDAGCGDVRLTVHQLAESLGNAIDARDPHTHSHSDEVAETARVTALAMGCSFEQAEMLHIAGHLHDIGKIGIPDNILRKASPLDDEEWEIMRSHPLIGANIIRPVALLAESGGVVDVVLHHHERWDGKGYPHGLAGRDIPLGARIIAVADTLSAMLQTRPYREGRSFGAAVAEIVRCSGSQFDPAVVEAFVASLDRVKRAWPAGGQAPAFMPPR
ncbi:HD-GYP domain-containing protein [Oleidesulfovibrio alaskensis]|jgi:HD-GYP domain-containing protein (c-di-GMP phosphodiesterase class II)|uniref:HD-GYP domain-containing protein n=1 Tax=Oleidesulfovibrio alaskensis TaxID=58180 RepID=UPI001A5C6483|nr:HD-GYP domain-containing protein [Oleidesulfovibrio alaskensis]MBL3582544.1 HD-GYP domain-containing protein [Oleidesulfovibrio alaskensis]